MSFRIEFYETDENLTILVFDRGANPAKVTVKFEPKSVRDVLCHLARGLERSLQLEYKHESSVVVLQPLKDEIVPFSSSFSVGIAKVEIKLRKAVSKRWGSLIGNCERFNTGCMSDQ